MFSTLIRTLFGRFIFILFLLFCAPFFLIFLCMPRSWLLQSHFFGWCEYWFYRIVLKISLLPITYTGLEHVSHPAIIVGNHQSSFDVPLVGVLLNAKPHVWLSLAELRNSIFLRFILPKVSILVDMSSPANGVKTLREAITLLQEKPLSVVIFPEGGRFTDGHVHSFYSGFALIAGKTKLPVVPVYINGVQKAYPPGSFMIHSSPITVTIGAPFSMQEGESEDAFKDRVYQWFKEQEKV